MPFDAMKTTRFVGVTNVGDTHPAANLQFPYPALWHEYFNDFDQFVAGDWTVTETQAGATQALIAGDGGLISLVNSAADNDINSIQKLPAAFLLSASKKLFIDTRFSVDDITQSDVLIGLGVVSATPFTTLEGIYILKADDAATALGVCRLDGTTGVVNTTLGSIVAGFNRYSAYYDGNGTIYHFLNNNLAGTATVSAVLPDTILTPTISLMNGSAAARTLNCDWFYAAQER